MRRQGPEQSLRKVYLHGALGERFGTEHQLAVSTAGEAVRAFTFQLPGFRQAIAEGSWRVVRGDPDTGFDLDIETLTFGLGKQPLHIIPAPIGSGRGGGGGKTVVGIALLALAVAFAIPSGGTSLMASAGAMGLEVGAIGTGAALSAGLSTTAFLGITYGQIALMGAALTLTGISALVAPAPRTNVGQQAVDKKGSFVLSGPQNTSVEGVCVPHVYGRVRVGSVVGAATMTIADYSASAPTPGADPGDKSGASETYRS